MLFASNATEDNPGTGSPLSAGNNGTSLWGVGTSLSATFGSRGTALTSMNVAYIVVPTRYPYFLDIHVNVLNPTGDVIESLNAADFGFFIGEVTFVGVSGNGVAISDGDVTPSLADNSDFGVVAAGSVQQRTYSIDVSGFGSLSLQPPVLTGPYSIVGEFPSFIEYGSVDFTLALDTNAGLGEHPGSISFANDSSNANLFNFALHSLIIPEPSTALLSGVLLLGILCKPRRQR